MANDKERSEKELEAEMDEELDRIEVGDACIPMADDIIVDVAFGDPEDDEAAEQRISAWVASFPPGRYQKQVADLFLSEGEVYVMMDKMSITIPLIDLFRVLERGGLFKQED